MEVIVEEEENLFPTVFCPSCETEMKQLWTEEQGMGDYYLIGEKAYYVHCGAHVEECDEN